MSFADVDQQRLSLLPPPVIRNSITLHVDLDRVKVFVHVNSLTNRRNTTNAP